MSEESHIKFYDDIRALTREAGISLAMIGGLACLKLNIVEFTKDVDFVIGDGPVDSLLRILGGLRHHASPCRYRLEISAPLDSRWLTGGWSSHFTFGDGGTDFPSLDIYMRSAFEYRSLLVDMAGRAGGLSLLEQHPLVLDAAERCLPQRPIDAQAASRLYDMAASAVTLGVEPWLAECLPLKDRVLKGMEYA